MIVFIYSTIKKDFMLSTDTNKFRTETAQIVSLFNHNICLSESDIELLAKKEFGIDYSRQWIRARLRYLRSVDKIAYNKVGKKYHRKIDLSKCPFKM